MPCGSFTSALAMTVLTSDSLTVARRARQADIPLSLSVHAGGALERLERPPPSPRLSRVSLSGHFFLTEVRYVQVPVTGRAGRYRQFSALATGQMTVYKSQYCGCCKTWIKHMKENGFEVKVVETEQLDPIKQQHGITPQLASCHTGVVNGYVVEGHVPAADVQKLLKENRRSAV